MINFLAQVCTSMLTLMAVAHSILLVIQCTYRAVNWDKHKKALQVYIQYNWSL